MDDCKLDVFEGIVIDELEGPADVVGDVDDGPAPDKVERSFEHVERSFDDVVDADKVDVEDEIDGEELS